MFRFRHKKCFFEKGLLLNLSTFSFQLLNFGIQVQNTRFSDTQAGGVQTESRPRRRLSEKMAWKK
jgi:hypothetical protein